MQISPLPDWTSTYRPAVEPGELYYRYLARALAGLDLATDGQVLGGQPLPRYFGEAELVVPGSYRKLAPPRELWPNMVLPLALALLLRQTMVAQGFGPLIVVATFRPGSGAGKSRHKVNAAIDLKPPKLTSGPCRAIMNGAAWLWRTHAHLNVGIGTYGPHMDRTTLVHIDAGQRARRTCWRQVKGVSTTPAVSQLPPAAWEV